MYNPTEQSSFQPETVSVDWNLDVRKRLKDLKEWEKEWKEVDASLAQMIDQLDEKSQFAKQKGLQIANLRKRLLMQLVRSSLEVLPEKVAEISPSKLRRKLQEQFASLTREERLLWLYNFLFIMTPDLRKLNEKIANVRRYRTFGQRRNFLLGGESGMGKTTYLDWLASHYIQTVEATRNHVPIIKIDAPVNNRSAKPLYQRIILECGKTYSERDQDEDLLMLVVLYLQKCSVEMLILDEIGHIVRFELRRRVLELSNLVSGTGLTTVCASCDPIKWIEGDAEVAGRWNDYFYLAPYKGERLKQLLAYIELLLPFTKDLGLTAYSIPSTSKHEKALPGPAQLIEQLTGGILRDVMMIIVEASAYAIVHEESGLSVQLLEDSWRRIQENPVEDVVSIIQAHRTEMSK